MASSRMPVAARTVAITARTRLASRVSANGRPRPLRTFVCQPIGRQMHIRSETSSDEEAISALITTAFLEAEHSGGDEAEIVEALRRAGKLAVSLVATQDQSILGHVGFSPVLINGKDLGWFGLAPVAVMPGHQRKGIGTALIKAGLTTLNEKGASGCVVLGEPAYYSRFGFIADPALQLAGIPPEYFLRVALRGQPCSGKVLFHPAFGVG